MASIRSEIRARVARQRQLTRGQKRACWRSAGIDIAASVWGVALGTRFCVGVDRYASDFIIVSRSKPVVTNCRS